MVDIAPSSIWQQKHTSMVLLDVRMYLRFAAVGIEAMHVSRKRLLTLHDLMESFVIPLHDFFVKSTYSDTTQASFPGTCNLKNSSPTKASTRWSKMVPHPTRRRQLWWRMKKENHHLFLTIIFSLPLLFWADRAHYSCDIYNLNVWGTCRSVLISLLCLSCNFRRAGAQASWWSMLGIPRCKLRLDRQNLKARKGPNRPHPYGWTLDARHIYNQINISFLVLSI